MNISRRGLFLTAAAGGVSTGLAASTVAPEPASLDRQRRLPKPRWGRSFEGQRMADLGNGTYLNPIVAGDHPDPTILKDGRDYYMTFSSFFSLSFSAADLPPLK